MKKILFIFALLIGLNGFTQNKLSYSTELDPLILEFVNEAAERDYIVFPKIVEGVDWIVLVNNLHPRQMGGWDKEKRVIFIRNGMDVITAKITLFHELAHMLTDSEDHSCEKCTDIMSAYALKDHSYYEDTEVYEAELDTLFNYIKNFKK